LFGLLALSLSRRCRSSVATAAAQAGARLLLIVKKPTCEARFDRQVQVARPLAAAPARGGVRRHCSTAGGGGRFGRGGRAIQVRAVVSGWHWHWHTHRRASSPCDGRFNTVVGWAASPGSRQGYRAYGSVMGSASHACTRPGRSPCSMVSRTA
jgi:hypothetical protein